MPFLRGASSAILDALAAESASLGIVSQLAATDAGGAACSMPSSGAGSASADAPAGPASGWSAPLVRGLIGADGGERDAAYETDGDGDTEGAGGEGGLGIQHIPMGHDDAAALAAERPFLSRLRAIGYRPLAAMPLVPPKPIATASGAVSVEDAAEKALPYTEAQLEALPWLQVHLKPHQVEGVNWLLASYRHGINCILADDMGLGKTVQAIAFLGVLTLQLKVPGPHLVICPLSVLAPWLAEFRKWAPSLRVVRLHTSDREERELLKRETLADLSSFDVVLTTYEMAASQSMRSTLCRRIHWRYAPARRAYRLFPSHDPRPFTHAPSLQTPPSTRASLHTSTGTSSSTRATGSRTRGPRCTSASRRCRRRESSSSPVPPSRTTSTSCGRSSTFCTPRSLPRPTPLTAPSTTRAASSTSRSSRRRVATATGPLPPAHCYRPTATGSAQCQGPLLPAHCYRPTAAGSAQCQSGTRDG